MGGRADFENLRDSKGVISESDERVISEIWKLRTQIYKQESKNRKQIDEIFQIPDMWTQTEYQRSTLSGVIPNSSRNSRGKSVVILHQ